MQQARRIIPRHQQSASLLAFEDICQHGPYSMSCSEPPKIRILVAAPAAVCTSTGCSSQQIAIQSAAKPRHQQSASVLGSADICQHGPNSMACNQSLSTACLAAATARYCTSKGCISKQVVLQTIQSAAYQDINSLHLSQSLKVSVSMVQIQRHAVDLCPLRSWR